RLPGARRRLRRAAAAERAAAACAGARRGLSAVRAIWIERHGGPEVLELRDVRPPEPGPGELLVDVTAIGVNYRDVYERAIPGYAGPLPRIVGVEGAGTARSGGRVAWVQAPGSYAEQVVVAAEKAVPIPDGV